MMRQALAAAVAGASLLALAAAPDRPALAPSREASVLYRVVNADAAPIEVRVTAEAGGSPMRLDLPDRTYMLVDQAAHRIEVVVPDEQVVLDVPYQDGPQTHFQLNDRMRFTRRAPGTVAAVRCTVWDVAVDNTRGTMCISDDGILLRSSGLDTAGRRNLIEAVSVSFAPASADEFVPPADFSRMAATPDRPIPAAPAAPPSQASPP
jgi:hypothetical protein